VRKHLDYAADYLVALHDAAVKSVPDEDKPKVVLVLKDDPNDVNLMTLTFAGVQILAHVFRSHHCAPDCNSRGGPMCPLLYLAWVVEDCPEGGVP
jgi:hypothetical protein